MRWLCVAAFSVCLCPAQSTTPKFLYVAADYLLNSTAPCGSSSVVIGYTVDANTGDLTPMPGSPFNSPGAAPVNLAPDPMGRFVWVVNEDTACTITPNGTIGTLRVDPVTGALTPSGPLVSSAGWEPIGLAVDPLGKFVFVTNKCVSAADCSQGSVSVYSVNQVDGTLSPVAGSPFPAGVPILESIAVDPAGQFAFVAGSSLIAAFSIDPTTGALAPAGVPVPTPAPATQPQDIAVDPSGKFAIVINPNSGASAGTIADWSIGAGGSLTALGATSTIAFETFYEAIHPSGRYVYTTGCPNGTGSCPIGIIQGWNLDPASGSLTLLPLGGVTALTSYGGLPFVLSADPSGKFLFVVNTTSTNPGACQEGNVVGFPIDPNSGTLPLISNLPVPDLTPSEEAVTTLAQPHVAAATLTGVQVSPGALTVPAGQAAQFTAVGSLSDATTEYLSASSVWTSSNPGVASVSSKGVALAASAGSTIVSACYNGLCGSATLTVTGGTPPPVSLFPPNATFSANDTQSFTLTNNGPALGNLTIQFNPRYPSPFSETDTCGTSLASAASCVIHVTFASGAAVSTTAELDVFDGCNRIVAFSALSGGAALSSIAITPAAMTIAAGTAQQYTATGTYTDGSTQNITGSVTWSSSDPTVATINAAGLATGVKAGGPLNIQATLSGITSNTAFLTVTAPVPVSIAVAPAAISVPIGETAQFTATATFSDGSTQNVTSTASWTSSDTTIATINASGLASGVKAGGPVNIQATLGGISSNKALLTVTSPPVVSIAVTPGSASVIVGRAQVYRAIATYSDGSTADISTAASWSSTNPALAPIGSIGVAFGLVVGGPVTITAKLGAVVSNPASLTVGAPTPGAVLAWGDNSTGQLGNGGYINSNVPIPVQLTRIVQVGSGYLQNVALQSNDTVWTWGDNTYGALGNGTNMSSNVPITIPSLTNVLHVASGAWHSVALRSDGTVWTWGLNSRGQLGNGTLNESNVPVQVSGLTGVIAIAAGALHTVALKADGTVWDWGFNGWGQLGNGTVNDSPTPVPVSGLSGVVAISAGVYFNLALKADGSVWAWGDGTLGQLGNGANTIMSSPVRAGMVGAIAIAAGDGHSLALKSDGTVWSWGRNDQGELGNGNTTATNTPAEVSGLSGIVVLAAGHGHSLALKSDGTVAAWGEDDYGELGNGANAMSTTPVAVMNATNVVSIAGDSTSFHSMAITTNRLLLSIAVTPLNALIAPGSSQQFVATAAWSDGTTQNITGAANWSSSDATVATMAAGLANGIKPGRVTITASMGGAVGLASLRVAVSSGLFAWGDNSFGQLGNGTLTNSNVPYPVTRISGVVAAAAGFIHTVALKADGTVWTWGDNIFGQLGTGNFSPSTVPVAVPGLTGVVDIAGGGWHTVALKSDGSLWAWGYNASGQLGDGTLNTSNTPVQLSLTGVIAIAAGEFHTMALKADGTVWAWGWDAYGQLGDGANANRVRPFQVAALSGVTAIAAGEFHSMALTADGSVWTWGDNTYGELGSGNTTSTNLPAMVSGISGVAAIHAAGFTSVVLKSDGTIWDWGYDSTSNTITNKPVQVSGLNGVTAIAGGRYHVLALLVDGTVWGFGENVSGQLGDETFVNRSLPVEAAVPSTVLALGSGSSSFHSLAIAAVPVSIAITPRTASITVRGTQPFTATATYSDGSTKNITNAVTWTSSDPATAAIGSAGVAFGLTASHVTITAAVGPISAHASLTVTRPQSGAVLAWGDNGAGQLGNGSYVNSNIPVTAQGLANIVQVASGYLQNVALQSDGTIWTWGDNTHGALGIGTNISSNVPVNVPSLTNVLQVASGAWHSAALRSDGTVWTWGWNFSGQLGNGTLIDSNVPVAVSGLTGVIAIAAGTAHTVALKRDGTVWDWGFNGWGQLGNGTVNYSPTPVQVSGLSGVVAISAGVYFNLALKADGSVWAWGQDVYGQLGDGANTNQSTPVRAGVNNVVAIAAGSEHSLALKSDGTVWSWGRNEQGELGNGNTTTTNTPASVAGLSGIVALAAGHEHSLALKSDGTVAAWGEDDYGELGNGANAMSTTPVAVLNATNVVSIAGDSTSFHSLAITTSRFLVSIAVSPFNALIAPGGTQRLAVVGTYSDGTTRDVTGLANLSSAAAAIATVNPGGLVKGLAPGTAMISASLAGESAIGVVRVATPGALYAWGLNQLGQLGTGNQVNSDVPVPVGGRAWVSAAGGDWHSIALKLDGTVWAWGLNADGELGNGNNTNSNVPVPVSTVTGLSGVVTIAAGGDHSVALKSDGTVWAWGFNLSGQLGNGTTTTSNVPVKVNGLERIIAVAAGGSHSMALRADGTVFAWGYNFSGELGTGNTANSLTPVQVSGLSGVTAIAAGSQHSMALTTNGTVWAWGSNFYGSLGNGNFKDNSVPAPVNGVSGAVSISAGGSTSVALKPDGTVWVWGADDFGQFGNGTVVSPGLSVPTQATGITGAVALGGGRSHVLALKSDGTLWAWGRNDVGQLGNASTLNSSVPVPVVNLTGVAAVARSPEAQHSLAIVAP